MVMLYGPGLARIGATAEVTHGGLPYTIPQRWSSALHAHPTKLEGIAIGAHEMTMTNYVTQFLIEWVLISKRFNARRNCSIKTGFMKLFDVYGVGLVS